MSIEPKIYLFSAGLTFVDARGTFDFQGGGLQGGVKRLLMRMLLTFN
jgi:hypothetical protein